MNPNLKAYVLAARPKTLPAAIVPVWLGCVLAWKLEGKFNAWLAFYTFMGAVWIQIATNFFNDAIDHKKGADTTQRLGPIRATSSGLLSTTQVYATAFGCLLVACVFGLLLFQARGWAIIAIGIPSLYFCYGYTGGPLPLAYKGLGELFVVLFFGIIAVTGTVFIQLNTWSSEALLLGMSVGLLSAVLISINNLRDHVEDRENNKRTLAVKLGEKWGKRIIFWESMLASKLIFILGVMLEFGIGNALLCIMFFPYLLLYLKIKKEKPSEKWNAYLAHAGVFLLLYGVLFTRVCFLKNHSRFTTP